MQRLEDIKFGDNQREIETSRLLLSNQVLLQESPLNNGHQLVFPFTHKVKFRDLAEKSAQELNELDRRYGVQVDYSDYFRAFVSHGLLIIYEDGKILTPGEIGTVNNKWETLMPEDVVPFFKQKYMKQ